MRPYEGPAFVRMASAVLEAEKWLEVECQQHMRIEPGWVKENFGDVAYGLLELKPEFRV